MKTYIYIFLFLIQSMVFMSCEDSTDTTIAGESGTAPTGQGGSLARFALRGDYLYCVDHATLKAVHIADPDNMVVEHEQNIGREIETIFPKDSLLFIGSALGMMIYDISNPNSPEFVSNVQHVFSCDPVVADSRYAYITLSTGARRCWRGVNELQILDITDIHKPRLLKTYNMTNPQGLGIDDATLFVCDNGLKVYDASNVFDLKQLHQFTIPAFDVIPNDGVLMVIASDGVYQYSYDGEEVKQLSKISYTGK